MSQTVNISNRNLLKKYNVPAPRYTSYPTVPYWQEEAPSQSEWFSAIQTSFTQSNEISIYIHLPFCEQLCTYCGCNTRITKRHSVEMPYLEAVLAEWKMYLKAFSEGSSGKPVLKELHLGGGTPTFFSPENLKWLIQQILATVEVAGNSDFGFEAHPSSTTEAHLVALREVGFNRISLGIQDFNQDILKLINRFQTEEQIVFITQKARELDYDSVNYDLIFGLPKQTETDIIYSMNRLKELRPDRLAFYSYAHIPWVKGSQRAYSEQDLPTNQEKRQLYETGKEILTKLGYLEIGLDHFALPSDDLAKAMNANKLHRNFMGYTPAKSNLLIGLGASSISEAGTAYVQNAKRVEFYQNSIKAEMLPIFKGHLLTEEDQKIKQLISKIMCQKSVNWSGLEISLLETFRTRLADLEMDGLVETSFEELRVTEIGLPFLKEYLYGIR